MIHPIQWKQNSENAFYLMREDLLPFSFGGNKVRIAQSYLEEMECRGCDYLLAYGNSRSNLCRVLANLCRSREIPCGVISPLDDDGTRAESGNSLMVRAFSAEITVCGKAEVPETIAAVKAALRRKGFHPYYIYDSTSVAAGVAAYVRAYGEITEYEAVHSFHFDLTALPSGTGMTQAGLLCGALMAGADIHSILGLSVARGQARGRAAIHGHIEAYRAQLPEETRLRIPPVPEDHIRFNDAYILDGYASYNREITETIRQMLFLNGVPMDTTYTGKAFWALNRYLSENHITGKKILFLHTGGLPLFFDRLALLK